jgi:hypothetical protein
MKSNYKQRQAIKATPPRVLKRMAPSARGAYSKSNTGRTSGRSKHEYLKPKLAASMLRGREKIMALLDRGIRLTS